MKQDTKRKTEPAPVKEASVPTKPFLPFLPPMIPLVELGPEGEMIFCNRLATALLMPKGRWQGWLNRHRKLLLPERIFQARFAGEEYSVYVHRETDGKTSLRFFRDFNTFHPMLIHSLLSGERADFAFALGEHFHLRGGVQLHGEIRARWERFHQSSSLYLAFLEQREEEGSPEEMLACDPECFLKALSGAAADVGMVISLKKASRFAVSVRPRRFTLTVMDLLRFVYLLEGDVPLDVSYSAKSKEGIFTFRFPSKSLFFKLFAKLAENEMPPEGLESLGGVFSLLSALLRCVREEACLAFDVSDATGRITLRVPLAADSTAGFLDSDTDALHEYIGRFLAADPVLSRLQADRDEAKEKP